MPTPSLRERSSGVLLHVTSLPGPHGSGDLGAHAREFADFLGRSGQRWWQMLPVGPAGYGDSPYSALSAFAGNPIFIDLDQLGVPVEHERFSETEVDFDAVNRFRDKHLRRAFAAFLEKPAGERRAFATFVEREAAWLDDFALYSAIKRAHGGAEWTRWEDGLRLRNKSALARAMKEHAGEIELAKWTQWVFAEQWSSFRAYCNDRGIGLIGDLPIFVAHDSADVWQHRELFKLDETGMPTHVAGVPPDYFSTTGQRWGNPLYRWDLMAESGYAWWVDRFRAALSRFDAVRLDHFIGFVRYWQIPSDEPTAVNGKWLRGPGRALFDAVGAAVGTLPLIAEDLGAVTPKVTRLRRELGLPGIRLVQFAFGTDPQAPSFLPHNHDKNAVVYTGTHDNDTAVGWFSDPGGGPDATRSSEQAELERQTVLAYMGRENEQSVVLQRIHWEMIRLAMMSVARTCIVPLQDILGLGSEARMNRPGNPTGNWRWRFTADALGPELERRLSRFTRTYGRAEVTT